MPHPLSGYLITAQEDERRQIARQLHDDFGQRIAVIEMCLDRLSRQDAKPELAMIREQIHALDCGLREISNRLHPSILTDIGLPAALQALIEDSQAGGREAYVHISQPFGDLSPEVATALYRIAQEALRNAAKHAPGAPVRLHLSGSVTDVKLTIEDAGPGFDLNQARAKGAFGLLTIEERARLVGGTLSIGSSPDTGTSLEVSAPRFGLS